MNVVHSLEVKAATVTSTEPATEKGKITSMVILLTAGLILTGTLNTIGFKSQILFYNFKHGFVQTMFVYIGMFLNLIVFNIHLMSSSSARKEHFQELHSEAKQFKKSMKVSKLIQGIPAFFDSIGGSIDNLSLLLLPPSVYLILKGGTIVINCIVSRIMLGRLIERHHIVGNVLALIGFTLVGLSALLNTDSINKYSLNGEILGIILLVISMVLGGVHSNVEELIVRKYAVSIPRMAGIEGFFGMIWTMAWCAGLTFFACPDNGLCDIHGYLEDPIMALREVAAYPGLIAWSIILVISIMFFNICALNLTKRVSCIYNSFWSSSRCISVWLVSILLGFETWNWTTSPIQVVGFGFFIVGNLTYNEIIEWKICDMKKNREYQVLTSMETLNSDDDNDASK